MPFLQYLSFILAKELFLRGGKPTKVGSVYDILLNIQFLQECLTQNFMRF